MYGGELFGIVVVDELVVKYFKRENCAVEYDIFS